MGQDSKIAWTNHTFNPWWGCTPVSAGCAHCYAASFAKRTGQDCFGSSPRRFFKDAHWAEPLKWAKAAREDGRKAKVFCASMADVFEDAPGLDEHRHRLFDLIQRTPELDWLLLTKRADRMLEWFGGASGAGLEAPAISNLWLGVTVENQHAADERIPLLIQTPAAVRFLSCEPLVGPVDLSSWIDFCPTCDKHGIIREGVNHARCDRPAGISWVIVGGESGAQARPFDLAWARSIVDQCDDAWVACFVKQMGRNPLVPMDGPKPSAFPFADRDGRDLTEWPEDLRVRQFPRAGGAA